MSSECGAAYPGLELCAASIVSWNASVHEVGAEAEKKLRRLLRVIGERGIDRDVAHARLRPM